MDLRKCCVGNCHSTSRTHRLFCLPKNDNLRHLWLSFLIPTNIELSGLSKDQLLTKRVCQNHFDRYQFDHVGNRLLHGYPCLFSAKEISCGIPLSSNVCDNLRDHNYSLPPPEHEAHIVATAIKNEEDHSYQKLDGWERMAAETSGSKNNLAGIFDKDPFIDLNDKSAAKAQNVHILTSPSDPDKCVTETQATQLSPEYDVQSDIVSSILHEDLAEKSVPGPKIFSWQKSNEIIPVPADDGETEAVANNLSMYWDDEDRASLLSQQLDRNSESDPVSLTPHEIFRCNICDAALPGFRYTCVQCSDLDLCGACEAARAHHHHYVLRVPADRHAAEVQLVLATIRRYLMRKLDPITQLDQELDDAISVKSEVKSEEEDNDINEDDYYYNTDDTKETTINDELKRTLSPVTPQHGHIQDEKALLVDMEDEAPQEECREVHRKRLKNTKKIYMELADFIKIKEHGLSWEQIFDSNEAPCVRMPNAQLLAKEAAVMSETVAIDTRPRVQHASAQSQRKFRRVLQEIKQKDLQTKIIKAPDIDESLLPHVNIVDIKTSVEDTGQTDLIHTVLDMQKDVIITPGSQPRATARDVQSNALCAKPEYSTKLKRLASQDRANAGKRRTDSGKRRENRKLRPRIIDYDHVINCYSDEEFKSHFRLSRNTFNYLHELIREDLVRRVPGCRTIPSRHQLMIALLKMGTTESYRSVCDRFNVGRATAVRAVRRVCHALFKKASTFIQWPTGDHAIEVMCGFERASGFPKIIGAIDETHIRINAPKQNSVDYINRKGFHSIQLQVVCDHKTRITHCYVGHPGSVHDQRVFGLSEVADYLNDDDAFPEDSHILGDSAYEIHQHLLTPYRDNGHLSDKQKKYNYLQSAARVTVERCIGLLKGRMRSLLHCLPMTRVDLMAEYIVACCVIHNICILRGDEIIVITIPAPNEENNSGKKFNRNNSHEIRRNAGIRKRDVIMNSL